MLLTPILAPLLVMLQGDLTRPGISETLARTRAGQVSAIAYSLDFDLAPGLTSVAGRVTLRFANQERQDVVLDFAGEELRDAKLNGHALASEPRNGHLVLPADSLRGARNVFTASFRSKVAKSGTPLTVYRDASDGQDYCYTLLVPADAHRLFPCFDQPDLKATFELTLTIPGDWTAVGNASLAEPAKLRPDGRQELRFAPTLPLPTYLFAFAAGPFATIEGPAIPGDDAHRLRLVFRPAERSKLQVERLFALHEKSLAWLGDWFRLPYAFGKLDVVLVPGFPYGGMEHAGAIFYRESALSFDHEPTAVEELRRSTLVYHEVAHQWFGNLVTMRWFDDLWLKEGFATWLAFAALADLEPETSAWLRFHQTVKPTAYRVDATRGTTPIWQPVPDLDAAKSNYGPIVYDKAPAVLRELSQRVGDDVFRQGLRVFLTRHHLGNATWQDLLAALESVGARGLELWSQKWILSAGMPRVQATLERGADGSVCACRVAQTSAQGWPASPWPLRLDVLATPEQGEPRLLDVSLGGVTTSLEALKGQRWRWLLLNARDGAYGLFLLDPTSAPALLADLPHEKDALRRAVAWSALVATAREGELDPRQLFDLALVLLAGERDPLTRAGLVQTAQEVALRWLPDQAGMAARERLETLLRQQLVAGEVVRCELQTFRELARIGRSAATLDLLRGLLDGGAAVPGLVLGTQDRFFAGAALLARGDPGARDRLEALRKASTGDVARYLYEALAAAPDAAVKEQYFAGWLSAEAPAEQWVVSSLGYFHWPGQASLTFPFLERALDRIAWLQANRKIFFVPSWVESFVGAHASPEALAIVDRYLETADLPRGARLKVVQARDELGRVVRIRAGR